MPLDIKVLYSFIIQCSSGKPSYHSWYRKCWSCNTKVSSTAYDPCGEVYSTFQKVPYFSGYHPSYLQKPVRNGPLSTIRTLNFKSRHHKLPELETQTNTENKT